MMHKDDCDDSVVFNQSYRQVVKTRRVGFVEYTIRVCAGFAIFFLAFIAFDFFRFNLTKDSFQTTNVSNNAVSDDLFVASSLDNDARVFGEGGPEITQFPEDEIKGSFNDYAKTEQSEEFIPSIYPLIGEINNEFGWRRNPFGDGSSEYHAGMDIDGEKGSPVVASASGIVVKAGWQGGYGNLIEINHGSGTTTRYGHLSSIAVEINQRIERGQEIGKVGSTGRSTGPHLHYEVRLNNLAVNPQKFLPKFVLLNQK